jgi:cell division protein FtsB
MDHAAPSPAAREAPPAADRPARTMRLSARGAALAVVVVFLLTLAVAPLRTLLEQRGQLGELGRQTAELRRENADLNAEIDMLEDPRNLERMARECLGMVRPGEIAFVTVPRKGAPPAPRC